MNTAATPDWRPLRVVLVEDDPMVRQLLQMVWEDVHLTLVNCTRVPEALAALREAPADLIVTDLMLPGESGLDLLRHLAAAPALRGTARVAVFSAGLDESALASLRAFDVWRVLNKPLPIDALLACVRDAGARLRAPPDGDAAWPEGEPAAPAALAAPPVSPAEDPTRAQAQAQAVAEHFGGNRPLYEAFHSAALLQFVEDMAAGDAAVQRADAPALRRLAHGLKSVLESLGHGAVATLARALEDSAERADWPACRGQWAALRTALAGLASAPSSRPVEAAGGPAQQSVTPPTSWP